jgi:hypothetical protein
MKATVKIFGAIVELEGEAKELAEAVRVILADAGAAKPTVGLGAALLDELTRRRRSGRGCPGIAPLTQWPPYFSPMTTWSSDSVTGAPIGAPQAASSKPASHGVADSGANLG